MCNNMHTCFFHDLTCTNNYLSIIKSYFRYIQRAACIRCCYSLEKLNEKTNVWAFVEDKRTDKNGRVGDFLETSKTNVGVYKLTYFTSDYFKQQKSESFYPFIEVVFQMKDANYYHVPITLSLFGYSTYRGN
jgi:hydroxyisourate hydrolase